LNNIETKIFLETKLRNLKRKNAKLAYHPEFTDEYLEIDKEIKSIEQQLSAMT
jgi:hypothetical protein